jgi:hypothetical protein
MAMKVRGGAGRGDGGIVEVVVAGKARLTAGSPARA